jgi:hypothetical protein
VGTSSTVIHAADSTKNGALVNGTDNWQTNGATTADKGDGDTATGGLGPNAVDGIACSINQEPGLQPPTYHVHAFLGIMVNGTEMAIPDAIGMQNPDNNEPILGFGCAYNLHTHGSSGIIHVEDPQIQGNWNAKPIQGPPAKYNLQALMDIWGQSTANLAGGVGLPKVYVGVFNTTAPDGADLVTQYQDMSATPLSSILLQHHVAIWLVYGNLPGGVLPQVEFNISD